MAGAANRADKPLNLHRCEVLRHDLDGEAGKEKTGTKPISMSGHRQVCLIIFLNLTSRLHLKRGGGTESLFGLPHHSLIHSPWSSGHLEDGDRSSHFPTIHQCLHKPLLSCLASIPNSAVPITFHKCYKFLYLS